MQPLHVRIVIVPFRVTTVCIVSQMDPRDALFHAHRAAHAAGRAVHGELASRLNVDIRKYCQLLRPTTVPVYHASVKVSTSSDDRRVPLSFIFKDTRISLQHSVE